MDIPEIETVGIVGAGTMGHGIAQSCATAGYEVTMCDVDPDAIERGLASIDDSLSRLADSDRLSTDEIPNVTDRITGTTALDDLVDSDLVIEAVVENIDVKRDLFGDLDDIVEGNSLLATNTSTLSITTIAAATDRPEQVVGIHFMNPVAVMDGVEIVVGERTDPAVVDLAHEFVETLGKETWEADDKPGFVTNRILMPWINEGIRAYDEGVATKEDIDRGMKLGTNVPMGPLELADHIGLDVCLQASQTLADELGDRYQPAYLLKRKVDAGKLGKKTGDGFYTYGDSSDIS
jgi:3-hydroxybutyryl-CoA dehydrogenase